MKVLKYATLLFLLMACINFSKAQPTSAPIEMILFEMAQHNIYESSFVGFSAVPSLQYKRFQQMKERANAGQLVQYASSYHNPVVRLYALKALKEIKMEIPASLIQQFKNDSSKVSISIGCIKDIQKVSSVAATYIY
jgi:hypothetical protein